MKTRGRRISRKRKTYKNKRGGKKWSTALDVAQATLKKTGSISKARSALRQQAAKNARKLFGSM